MTSTDTNPTVCELDLGIGGMTCASCVGRVEKALRKVPGVTHVSVNLATESARIQYQDTPDNTNAQAILRRAVRTAGYEPRNPNSAIDAPEPSTWAGFLPIGIGLLLSAPLVLPMVGDFFGQHWMLPIWIQFLLASPVQFILGARFYIAGWHALKAGTGNMDLLVSIGTSAGWLLSMWLWLTAPAGAMVHVYFEGSAVVITLVLLGKWLETRAKRQTTSAIRALHALRPDRAHVLTKEGEQDLPVIEVLVDDILVIKPGERIPVDGVVQAGSTQVDESMLTGEPIAVSKTVGNAMTGGAINGDGRIEMRVTAVGQETVLAKIIRLVEDAQAAKAPIQRLVDQVSAIFVPVVLALAALTFVAWWFTGHSAEAAIIHAVAVLVIACPCALGLATPAAIMAGTGVAAKYGILIKDAQALELAHRTQIIAFDKTGTLTVGQPTLTQLHCQGVEADHALYLAASLQSGSEHPLGRATTLFARNKGIQLSTPSQLQAVPGCGNQGWVDAQQYVMGSLRWMNSLGVQLGTLTDTVNQLQAQGLTVSALAQVKADTYTLLAILAYGDEPKPGAAQVLASLRARGIKPVMISGDNWGAARAMALRLGLRPDDNEVLAEVLPADKAKHITQLKRNGQTVCMVGDGVNDAPALAAADVSIAMGNGTDVAMHAAGITLMRGDIALVLDALDISSRTVAKIKQNLFWAFAYNVAGIPLAALGYLNPVVAGAAMAMSSVSVMGNALLLKRWQPRRKQ